MLLPILLHRHLQLLLAYSFDFVRVIVCTKECFVGLHHLLCIVLLLLSDEINELVLVEEHVFAGDLFQVFLLHQEVSHLILNVCDGDVATIGLQDDKELLWLQLLILIFIENLECLQELLLLFL